MVESNTVYAPKTSLYLPGVVGNSASTPDHADLDITGDLCLIAKLSLDSWISGSESTLISKWPNSYILTIIDTGKLRAAIYDGANKVVDSTTNISDIVDSRDFLVLAVTIKVNISSEHIFKFWYSYDDITFYPLEDTSTIAASGNINNSTSILRAGAQSTSGNVNGNLYYAKVYDGIGDNSQPGLGTLVAEADFSYPWTNNKYRDKTGKIWTINGSAWAWEYQDDPSDRYDGPDIIYGGDAHSLIPDTVGGATASSLPTHIYEGDVI